LPLFKGKCPNGRKAFRSTVALPLYFEMKDEEVGMVVEELKKAING
jgi:dTDP-4-amino-4,6-dideoxygalactose transaminase